uniref:Uncharacterized protein n=1 Tax=Arundo donax TaxID=35708 RepID=A0A0A9FXB6_ARUDO
MGVDEDTIDWATRVIDLAKFQRMEMPPYLEEAPNKMNLEIHQTNQPTKDKTKTNSNQSLTKGLIFS